MSVPKGKRNKSSIAFYTEAQKLCTDMIKFLLCDFGIKKSSYDYNVFANRAKMSKEDREEFNTIVEKYGIEIESDYCRFVLYHYRDNIIKLLDDIMSDITRAYSIFPNTEGDWEMKRRYQNQVIGNLNDLKTKLTTVLKLLPINFEKYVPFINLIDDEIVRVKQWRGDCNKERHRCIENDEVKRIKAEKGAIDKIIAERQKEKEATIAERAINISKEINSSTTTFPRSVMMHAYNNLITGNYEFEMNDNNRIIRCSNPIPCLLTLDQYGNNTGPLL